MGAKIQVFLSYNSADKAAVEELYLRLRQEADIEPWLDKWDNIPGDPWQEKLERAITTCDVCAICIGRGDSEQGQIGPWQREEMRALINRRVTDPQGRFRVIPVLLPGAERGSRSSVPTFLVATTWVEFRRTLNDAEEFQRLLSGIRGRKPDPPSDNRAALAECPYRGLEFFDVAHAGSFLGREAVTQWLVDDIRKPLRPGNEQPRFLAILGASGSGKSSLARAGLYAALRDGAIEGSRDWLFVPPLRPGPNPLESLELTVLQAAAGRLQLEAVRHELRELSDKPDRLHRAARLLVPDTSPPRRLFLLVDQFEEVFTTCEKEDLRRPFIAALLHAVRERGGPVVLALAMRADFYPKVAAYEELARVVDQHQYLVGSMSEAELRLAIEEPAIRAGAEFEPGLVNKLLEAVHRQPGALPLLQHALLELWNKKEDGRRLTHAAYEVIGKLDGALERRANEVFRRFSADDQELCRRVFLRLVNPGEGTEDTKRRVQFRELLALGDGTRIQRLIETLAASDARLVVTEGGDSRHQDGFVEVVHETLIRSWSQLRKWLGADRAGLRIHRRLTEAAEDWDRAGKPKDLGALYSGARLATAAEWSARHLDDLSKLESEFLGASHEAEADAYEVELRQQRERAEAQQHIAALERQKAENNERAATRAKIQSRVAATFGLLAIIGALATFGLYRRASSKTVEAEQRTRETSNALAVAKRSAAISQAQALIVEANNKRGQYPLQSLLFASAAAETMRRQAPAEAPLSSVHQSLRDSLSNVGGRPLGHEGRVYGVEFSSDNHWLVTGSLDKTARLWDLRAADPSVQPVVLKGHEGRVSAVAFSPDNHWLVTGSLDKTARLWDLRAADPSVQPVVLKGHEGVVSAVAFSPDNHWLVTGSGDKTARLWDLRAADPSVQPVVLKGQEEGVSAVAFSPDNHWLVTANFDKTVRLWDLRAADPSVQPVVLKGHEDVVFAVAFSPDNHWLVTGSVDKTVRLWNLRAADPSVQPVVLTGHEEAVFAVGFSPDNRWLLTGIFDKTVRLWDLRAADPSVQPVVFKGHEGRVYAVAFSPDNHWLVTGSLDKTARLWDLLSADPSVQPIVLKGHEEGVSAVAFSPDNHWLVTGSGDKTARLWDLRAADPSVQPVVLKGHEGTVYAVAFSLDNHWLVTGSPDTARLWDLHAADPSVQPVVLKGHEETVYAVAFSSDKHWLVTGSWDNTARLWDLRAADPSVQSVVLKGHEGTVYAVAFSPDNRWLVTGSEDKTARLWDLRAADPSVQPVVLKGHEERVSAVAFSSDNHWLVTGSWDNTARLWDLRAADPPVQPVVLKGHEAVVFAVAFSPDNRWLVTGSYDRTARLWDLRAADPSVQPVVLKGHEEPVYAVAFSPDKHWLVTGSGDKTARLWDLRAADPSVQSVVLKGHEEPVYAVAFSPDKHWLVTGSGDKTARLWDLRAADPSVQPVVLKVHEEMVSAVASSPDNHCAVAFSTDNHWLVTGSGDKTARLWDLRAADPSVQPVVLKGHEGWISAVAFSPDNHWLVTGSGDKTARLWLLQIEDLVTIAGRTVGRNLSTNAWKKVLPEQPYFKVFSGLPVPMD